MDDEPDAEARTWTGDEAATDHGEHCGTADAGGAELRPAGWRRWAPRHGSSGAPGAAAAAAAAADGAAGLPQRRAGPAPRAALARGTPPAPARHRRPRPRRVPRPSAAAALTDPS